MKILEIITATIIATSTMTLFSYLISILFEKVYKEPVLLEFLMKKNEFKLTNQQKQVASWLIHYFIGLVFVIFYYLPFWLDCSWYKIDLFSGIVFGSIIGILGIIGWHIMFTLSPTNVPVNLTGYYLQLFFAHIIFGVSVVFVHFLIF